MSPRTGRPKTDTPNKDIRFSIRLDPETNQKLEDYCEKTGLIKAEAIRKAIEMLIVATKEGQPF